MKTRNQKWFITAVLALTLLAGTLGRAQDDGEASPSAEPVTTAEAGAEADEDTGSGNPGFIEIVFKGGAVNLIIWMMIFGTSAATVALIIDAMITVQRDKLRPEELVEAVRESLNEGDLDAAVEACEVNPCPLSSILMVGFSNITEGYDVIQESITSSAEIENEKLLQRVNYLNLCGQIAPMLGLLGTVTGMVRAFGTLGATGGSEAAGLASAISTALWTTAVGLMIAVPALLAYTLVRNHATRLILEIEATVTDLIKVLRNAEVEEEPYEEEFVEE